MPGDGKEFLVGPAGYAATDRHLSSKIDELARRQSRLANSSSSRNLASTTGAKSKVNEAEKAGKDFEALLLQQMLSTMWKTVPSGGVFGKSHESELYRDMFNEALAKSISEGQGIGIRDLIVRDMEKLGAGQAASNKK